MPLTVQDQYHPYQLKLHQLQRRVDFLTVIADCGSNPYQAQPFRCCRQLHLLAFRRPHVSPSVCPARLHLLFLFRDLFRTETALRLLHPPADSFTLGAGAFVAPDQLLGQNR